VNAISALRGQLEENDREELDRPLKMSAADDSDLATRLHEVASTARVGDR
jgi:hypothetical protein